MTKNYLATSVLMACLSKSKNQKKDIHTQLKETIAEHKIIMRAFEKLPKEQNGLLITIGKKAA
jgi:hypothetical protein